MECSKQTQNLTTNPKLGEKNSGNGRKTSSCLCLECSKQKPKTRQQTQNLEKKNRGMDEKHHGVCVCVWNVQKIPETRQQTQNSTTSQQLGNKKLWGGRKALWCVWNARNKPKTRQQTLYAFRLQ